MQKRFCDLCETALPRYQHGGEGSHAINVTPGYQGTTRELVTAMHLGGRRTIDICDHCMVGALREAADRLEEQLKKGPLTL